MANEDVGERGQWLFNLLMTEFHDRPDPYFRPRFLGDKYPTFDSIVEVVDHPSYFFFVQVKSTARGYTSRERRLLVRVSQNDVDRMVAVPAPTYMVGIDTELCVGYLLSVNEPRGAISSLATRHKIDDDVRGGLRDEVIEFWSSRNMVLADSRFKE